MKKENKDISMRVNGKFKNISRKSLIKKEKYQKKYLTLTVKNTSSFFSFFVKDLLVNHLLSSIVYVSEIA